MAIRDLKITPEQIARKGVIASPDTLTGTPDENKSVFDRLATEIIVPSVNGAIEMLGRVEDDTVQWETDEQARKLAEQERVSAEQGRAAAEQTRVQAEQERANADGLRTTAEEKRVAAERARSIAEQERVHAENSRVAAEQEREAAEQGRKAAEEARAQTERDRMLWETYSAIKNYVPGNKVEHGGSSYVNIAPCTGIAPPNSAHWQLVAARGKDGDGAGDMTKAVYDPTGKEQDIFAYSVPQTRKINKKTLSADVTLTGEDIKVAGSDETTIHTRLSELTNPNLLDNAYFVGGGTGYGTFPVNQKGRLSGSTDRQFICDRWNQFGSDWSLAKDGLVISKRADAEYWSFFQLIPVEPLSRLVGKTVTVSVLFDDSLVTVTQILSSSITYFLFENGERAEISILRDNTVASVQYYGSITTRTVKAMKLEVGTAQTLAYQDADGAWRLLPQPESDYATQLAKCQAYYWESDGWFSISQSDFVQRASSASYIKTNIRFPVPMNRKPTVTITSIKNKTPGILSDWASGDDTGIQATVNAVATFQSGFESIYSSNWVDGNYTFRVIASAEL